MDPTVCSRFSDHWYPFSSGSFQDRERYPAHCADYPALSPIPGSFSGKSREIWYGQCPTAVGRSRRSVGQGLAGAAPSAGSRWESTGWKANTWNVAFRFGDKQDSKLRACGDLGNSLANQRCHVRTPIHLVSWGHLAQLSQLCGGASDEGHLFKAARSGL